MKRTKLPMSKVEDHLSDLLWGLLYYKDDIQLKKIEDIHDVDINNAKLLEARLFGEQKEIHIFEYDGELIAVLNEDELQEAVDRKYMFTGRFEKEQKSRFLFVREYISFDPDGMAYIEYSRPVKVE